MHVFKGDHSHGAKGVPSTNTSGAKPRGWSTRQNDTGPVCASGRRSPRASELPGQPAHEQIAADAMAAGWRRSAAPSSLRRRGLGIDPDLRCRPDLCQIGMIPRISGRSPRTTPIRKDGLRTPRERLGLRQWSHDTTSPQFSGIPPDRAVGSAAG
jgi:hypothetical protein